MNDPKAWAGTTEFERGGGGVRSYKADATIENLTVFGRFPSVNRTK